MSPGQASDREALLDMLTRAVPARPWQHLRVDQVGLALVVSTGPDDADAVFFFGPGGVIEAVSVVEAHGIREAEEGPG